MAGLETREGFQPNHKEFGLHIRSDESVRLSAEPIAKLIALEANTNAPFDPVKRNRNRRHLKGSYRARRDGNLRVGRNSRAIWVVESSVLEASTKEFGTESQRPEYPLLRSAMIVVASELPGGANIRPPQNVEISSG